MRFWFGCLCRARKVVGPPKAASLLQNSPFAVARLFLPSQYHIVAFSAQLSLNHVLDCGKLAFHNRPWKLSLIRAGAEKEDCLLWTSIDGEFFMHKYLSSETTVSLSWLLSPAALCSAAALVSLHPLLLSSAQHLQTPLVPLPFLNASHGVTSVIFCCSMQQKLNQVKCHDQEMIQVKSNITNMSVFTLFDNCQVDRWPLSVQIMWARKKL